MAQDRQTAFGVTRETMELAERLAPIMRKRPEWEPFRLTASAVMRVALLRGLDQLESELKGKASPKVEKA